MSKYADSHSKNYWSDYDEIPKIDSHASVSKSKALRKRFKGHTCPECESYYVQTGTKDLSSKHRDSSRLKSSDPNAKLEFPSYEECIAKGYIRSGDESNDWSDYDEIPKTQVNVPYKYVEKLPKSKALRKQLKAHTCSECDSYYTQYGTADLSSRHRGPPAPKSPKHFWETEFPTDKECIERGYIHFGGEYKIEPQDETLSRKRKLKPKD